MCENAIWVLFSHFFPRANEFQELHVGSSVVSLSPHWLCTFQSCAVSKHRQSALRCQVRVLALLVLPILPATQGSGAQC